MNVIQLDKNGNAYGYPVLVDNFRMLFPTISFPNPLTPEAVEGYGYGCYEHTQAPSCKPTEKAVEVAPVKGEDGIYRQAYEIVPLTETEMAARTEAQWAYVRRDRDYRLIQTDWIVTKSLEAGTAVPTEWVVYRQALRDVTNQEDPFNITWPVKPE